MRKPAASVATTGQERVLLEACRLSIEDCLSRLASSEKGLEMAGANPALNTYYLEGPVRVLVSMDLYEYDKSKEDNLRKLAEPKLAEPELAKPK